MTVLVMYVGEVRMAMGEWAVLMGMGVRLAAVPIEVVPMLVMAVVPV